MKENVWDLHEACRYVHQIPLIVNKDKVSNQRMLIKIRLVIKGCWKHRRANFAGKLFDSV